MATGARVAIQAIPLNSTPGGALWVTSGTAGYDTGSPGGTITAWSSALGVLIPNNGQVILGWASGATAPGNAQVLIGKIVAGSFVVDATAEEYSIPATSQGWLGPWSPATYNQVNPAGVTYTGAINTTALTSAAQGCVVVDFTTTTTLTVRAYQLIPVSP